MDKKEMTQEMMSALVDGELRAAELAEALDALRAADNLEKWDVYHQIGDTMRSEDLAFSMSSDFSARMAARLDAEAPLTEPAAANSVGVDANQTKQAPVTPRRVGSGVIGWSIAGASLLALAAILMPRLLVNQDAQDANVPEVAGKRFTLKQTAHDASVSHPMVKVVRPTRASDGIFARENPIDDYLLAHQRFSPSAYRTVFYMRSANFTTDTEN